MKTKKIGGKLGIILLLFILTIPSLSRAEDVWMSDPKWDVWNLHTDSFVNASIDIQGISISNDNESLELLFYQPFYANLKGYVSIGIEIFSFPLANDTEGFGLQWNLGIYDGSIIAEYCNVLNGTKNDLFAREMNETAFSDYTIETSRILTFGPDGFTFMNIEIFAIMMNWTYDAETQEALEPDFSSALADWIPNSTPFNDTVWGQYLAENPTVDQYSLWYPSVNSWDAANIPTEDPSTPTEEENGGSSSSSSTTNSDESDEILPEEPISFPIWAIILVISIPIILLLTQQKPSQKRGSRKKSTKRRKRS